MGIPYGQKIRTAEEPVLHRAIGLVGAQSWGDVVATRLPRLPRSPNRSAQNHKIRVPGLNLGVRLRRLLMVIAQEPTQSLAALHGPLAADVCIAREQQDVVLPLVIALGMEMFDILAEGAPQRPLTEENHLDKHSSFTDRTSAPHRHS